MTWREQAACADVDPDVFFPATKGRAKAARRICRHCPVAADCYLEAVRNQETGVWGGVYFGSETARLVKARAR